MASPLIPPDSCPRLSPRARLQTDKITGKPVLLYPEGALLLNPTAHAIVCLCTGNARLQLILETLAERFALPVEQITDEVIPFLERLRAKNLLQVLEPADDRPIAKSL